MVQNMKIQWRVGGLFTFEEKKISRGNSYESNFTFITELLHITGAGVQLFNNTFQIFMLEISLSNVLNFSILLQHKSERVGGILKSTDCQKEYWSTDASKLIMGFHLCKSL